jgi:hypothetical protein
MFDSSKLIKDSKIFASACGGLFSLMSGGLSVPFVFAAVFTHGNDRKIYCALAFIALAYFALKTAWANYQSLRVELEMEFINPTEMDVLLHRYALRIKIRHSHPTKTLEKVRVFISKIECPAWKDPVHSFSFKKIMFPVYLPESGYKDAEIKHEIPPMPFEKSFDVFMVRSNFEESIIGVAPFEPPSEKESDRTHQRDYWTKNTFSFSEDDFNSPKPQFKITFQVVSDDVKTLEKTVILEVPTFSFLEMKIAGKSSSNPLIPLWIV